MNKKKLILRVLTIIGIVVLFVWVWFKLRKEATHMGNMGGLRLDKAGLSTAAQSPTTFRSVETEADYMGDYSAAPPDSNLLEEVRRWGRTPIEFYGKIVDELGRGVGDAQIRYSATDFSPEGRTMYETKSASDGAFFVRGIKGKNLVVRVSKNGYYEYQDSRRGFQYAGPGDNFIPNKAQPEIFRLHKKGQPAMLVALSRDIPLTGKDERININLLNLLSTKISEENVLLEVIRPQAPGSPWTYRLSVEGGGLLERTDPFEFQAPEQGYRPDLVVQTKQIVDKDIFLKFTNGNYARVRMGFLPGNKYLQVQSRLNPDGSRNLEYHPDYTIQVTRTHTEVRLTYSDPEARRKEREELIKDLKSDPACKDFELSEPQEY